MNRVLGLSWIGLLVGLTTFGAELQGTVAETAMTSGRRTEERTTSLRLNFRGAPLEMVLDYMSEAAGLTIVLETPIKGTVNLWSDQPVSRDEGLGLLNTALVKNGYAAIRDGKTLTIVNRDEAKTRSIPVKLGSEPDTIPRTDEIATQIMPVRFTEVSQLMKDLQPLVSARGTMTANESANALVLTDTQNGIHHAAKLLKAIDSGAEDVTVVKVFHLKHADPAETADLLSELFPSQNKSANNSSPIQFGAGPTGMGGFGNGSPGPGGQDGTQSRQDSRIKKQASVIAVADARTASLVVSASKGLMEQVERVVEKLDASPAGTQKVAVFHLKNAQAQQVAKVLDDLFQKAAATGRATSSQTDPLETRGNTQTQTQSQQNRANSQTGIGGNSGGPSGSGGGAVPQ